MISLHDIPREQVHGFVSLPHDLRVFLRSHLHRYQNMHFRIYMNRTPSMAGMYHLPFTIMFLHAGENDYEDECWATTWENPANHRVIPDDWRTPEERIHIVYE